VNIVYKIFPNRLPFTSNVIASSKLQGYFLKFTRTHPRTVHRWHKASCIPTSSTDMIIKCIEFWEFELAGCRIRFSP